MKKFTFMTYNILSQIHFQPIWYPKSPKELFIWNNRFPLLLPELNTDIIQIQEMQKDHYEDLFSPALQNKGYECHLKLKTKNQNSILDGCATFFNSSKFKLLEKQTLDYSEMAQSIERENKIPMDLFNMPTHNVALLLKLEHLETLKQFWIVNTHLTYKYESLEIQLFQCFVLFKFMRELIKKKEIPVILSGDLNTKPEGCVINFIERGNVDKFADHLKKFHFFNDFIGLKNVNHSFHFQRTHCDHFEPPFTYSTGKYCGILDYIYYEKDKMSLVGVERVLDPKEFKNAQDFVLPNLKHPSDHLPLRVEFEFK
jgi:CCR4-NOT transcription complex subunit 6